MPLFRKSLFSLVIAALIIPSAKGTPGGAAATAAAIHKKRVNGVSKIGSNLESVKSNSIKSIISHNSNQKGKTNGSSNQALSAWPCMDDLDKSLIKISLPVIANFAIAPLVGAVDLFFINRMGNALAVAGQSAANQVFGSVFWLTSFLPSSTLGFSCVCACVYAFFFLPNNKPRHFLTHRSNVVPIHFFVF